MALNNDAVKRTMSAMYVALGGAVDPVSRELANRHLLDVAREADDDTADLCMSLVEAANGAIPQPRSDYAWLFQMMEPA